MQVSGILLHIVFVILVSWCLIYLFRQVIVQKTVAELFSHLQQ